MKITHIGEDVAGSSPRPIRASNQSRRAAQRRPRLSTQNAWAATGIPSVGACFLEVLHKHLNSDAVPQRVKVENWADGQRNACYSICSTPNCGSQRRSPRSNITLKLHASIQQTSACAKRGISGCSSLVALCSGGPTARQHVGVYILILRSCLTLDNTEKNPGGSGSFKLASPPMKPIFHRQVPDNSRVAVASISSLRCSETITRQIETETFCLSIKAPTFQGG